ncbi:MAG: amidohydrolase [Candidatus Hermodarchaeota archaeon]
MVKKLFYNGSIITMNEHQPYLEAVGIEGEKVVSVGDLENVKNDLRSDYELIDLENNTMLPGFHDCHCHPIPYVFFLIILNLQNIKSYKEFKKVLRDNADKKKPGEWIFGLNYNELNFEDMNKLPDKWGLDKICPNNPVIILRFDLHIGIVNSKVLEIEGIDENSIPPEGCEYRKNEKGELNGIITEKANQIFIKNYTLPTQEQLEKAAIKAFQNLAEKGITTLHGIIHLGAGGEAGDLGAIEIPIMKSIQKKIHQNWYSFVYTKTPRKLKRIRKPPLHGGKEDSQFKVEGIKLYIDGSLGACTAWMHEPFLDKPDKSGICVYDNLDDLYDQMKEAHSLGYQIGVHAIGDKGNRELVNLYKRLLTEHPKEDHRHRIEHASLLTPDVIKDIQELGLITSIQPSFITTDRKLADYRLGPIRSKYTYPFKSLVDAGVICASGSDLPVEDPDIIWGIHALVNRDGFITDECLSVEEALKTYTINGAYAAFEERIKGSIEVGKLADLVILDKNPLDVPADQIKDIQVLETIIRGKSVFKKNV